MSESEQKKTAEDFQFLRLIFNVVGEAKVLNVQIQIGENRTTTTTTNIPNNFNFTFRQINLIGFHLLNITVKYFACSLKIIYYLNYGRVL